MEASVGRLERAGLAGGAAVSVGIRAMVARAGKPYRKLAKRSSKDRRQFPRD